ncbi:MAG: type II toxin-antitoxin system VapC family toxin [Nitrososphaerales archaeon]|nr:type II toxin-antitoxin system VapC family toxin [Nitrososphaerales archaeon]
MRKDLLYIDSNVFVYPLIYDPEAVGEAKKSKDFLLKIALGKVEAYTASVTWDEVVWVLRKVFDLELSVKERKKFLNFPNLRLLGVKKSTVFRAEELMEKYRIRPRDAIHAAVALENKITTIVSYDKDFDDMNEVKRIEP